MKKAAFPFILSDFEEYIHTLKTELTPDSSYEYYYRGCSDWRWKYNLTPYVYRDSRINNEDINFREMILRSPKDFLEDTTTLEKLVKMQHYGVATRILDISSNPLVALFFACQAYNNTKTNGKVYVFKIKKDEIKYFDSDAVSLISNLAKLRIDKTNFTKNFGSLIHEIREEKPHFIDSLRTENKKDVENVFLVKVKLNNNRIIRQSGAFFIFGIKDLKSKMTPAELPAKNILKEIPIAQSGKGRILNTLKALSIDKSTLFPELEYQAAYLNK